MPDWLDRYADALANMLEGAGDPGLQRGERNVVLDLARIVAHGTERKNAPLAAFVAGRYSALRETGGADRDSAVAEAVDAARRLLDASAEE
ncbi:MAG: DUF6457 domain-containing protein [Actinomycetota bacterium]